VQRGRKRWTAIVPSISGPEGRRAGETDLLSGLRRIGIDEIAYRKGQRYLTCVVDHDTGRLVWAAEGRNSETILKFFDNLGEQRAELGDASCGRDLPVASRRATVGQPGSTDWPTARPFVLARHASCSDIRSPWSTWS
jgi:hypothetical protein